MRYSAEDFAWQGTSPIPFGCDPRRVAATLRRMACDLERTGARSLTTMVTGVTVVEKASIDNWAATTVILRLHVPKERP